MNSDVSKAVTGSPGITFESSALQDS